MPKQSAQGIQYEKRVREILIQQLSIRDESGTSTVHHRQRLEGKSLRRHEIDLCFEFELAGAHFRVLVECKDHKKPIGPRVVEAFAFAVDDLCAQKGILASSSGFTSGAIAVARSKGIALVLADLALWKVVEPLSVETRRWNSPRLLDPKSGVFVRQPRMSLAFQPFDSRRLDIEAARSVLSIRALEPTEVALVLRLVGAHPQDAAKIDL